ncbi:putative retrotransposon hot spot (RHS) protein [Trypanosoma cruzi]|uniref:Putative retrotransposon hot spot (RHS) protein n=1 Tax=Trypanosoma cruzi TaxID=5693 RepID=A0A2V2UMA2_TRYCR|nr:putative retrotransposon hot spot (RHS) protein [Trypanosoma cruzi]
MGAGSYLLYQLLHCDVKKLQVVVYVIADEAFLFDKTAHTVTQYHTDEMSRSVIWSLRKRGMKGYVIYDVAKEGRNPSVFLVPSEWGMIVLTSPNENNFKQWKKDKRVVPIVIDCPHRIDLKAMCFWMKHIQPHGGTSEGTIGGTNGGTNEGTIGGTSGGTSDEPSAILGKGGEARG